MSSKNKLGKIVFSHLDEDLAEGEIFVGKRKMFEFKITRDTWDLKQFDFDSFNAADESIYTLNCIANSIRDRKTVFHIAPPRWVTDHVDWLKEYAK